MRLPTKPRQFPTSTPILPSFFASAMQVAITSCELRLAAHDLEQPHDVRRAEEMRADHHLRPRRGGGDLIDVQRRSVGGEDRARACRPVEFAEDLLLQRHAFEHRFDHHVHFVEAVVS